MKVSRSFYTPIVWIAHEYKLSGANYSLLEFIKTINDQGVKQILIVNRKGPVQERAEALGIEIKYVKFYSWAKDIHQGFLSGFSFKKQLRNLKAISQLIVIIRQSKAELVVTSTTTFNVGAWAAILTGRKHFWRISEFGELDFKFKLPWGRLSYRFMELTSQKILLNSKALLKKYKPLIKDHSKLEVVYNPVLIKEEKIRKERFWDPAIIKMLLIGQVNSGKGHMDAIKAVERLNMSQTKIKYLLSIVGSTPNIDYLNTLESYVADKALGSFVKFTSFTKDVSQLMYDHDILLMCSKAEAFGRVTAEGMKRYLPVIGTNSGGTLDMIEPNITGLLYTPGDVEELADKIVQLSESKQVNYKELTEKAFEKIQELTSTEKLVNTFIKSAS